MRTRGRSTGALPAAVCFLVLVRGDRGMWLIDDPRGGIIAPSNGAPI